MYYDYINVLWLYYNFFNMKKYLDIVNIFYNKFLKKIKENVSMLVG
jgi:hypothetical protein